MICAHCATENPANASHCFVCGAALSSARESGASSAGGSAQAVQQETPRAEAAQSGVDQLPVSPAPGAPAWVSLYPQAGGASGMYPAYPVYPGYPMYPGYPPALGQTGAYPSGPYPAPTPPTYSVPGSPGSPASAIPPIPQQGSPAPYSSYPLYPGYPAYPGYPYPPQASPTTGASTPEKRSEPGRLRQSLSKPFPLRVTLGLAIGSLLLVVVVYALMTLAGGKDWAAGAQIAGGVALGVAALALIGTIVRAGLGRRSASFFAAGLAAVVLVGALGTGGLLFSPQLHLAQAQSLERAGNWGAAIHEYTLAGENTSRSTDIARAYDEWGESLLSQGEYASAVTQFNQVLETYPDSGAPVGRAYRDEFQAYSKWLANKPDSLNYSNAIAFFNTYKASSLCDANCQSAIIPVELQSEYQYGVQLAAAGQYTEAITQFVNAQTLAPGSHYAHLAYQAAAEAYWNLGQQQLAGSDCADAVISYQALVSNYKNTPQAQTAAQALAAPVSVSGSFDNYTPSSYDPVVYLSKTAHAPAGQNVPASEVYFSDDYSTLLDQATSTFTFPSVAPGSYALSAEGANDTVWWTSTSTNQLIFSQVGPLCSTQLGVYDASLLN